MRESWTDGRLDDLNRKIDQRFDQVDQRFGRIEADLRALRLETKGGFDRVDERFDALHRLMIQFCGGMLAALIGLVASVIGLFATQL